jgi:two-component system, chemotaxis family, chemotaxis protein CheY
MTTNIMLIDDSATLRLQVRRALSAAGFGVIEAVDGVDGLEKLAQNPDVRLIVCDVNMPRMSGIEFVTALAAQGGERPPVIMLTTEGHPDMIRAAKACGARAWMSKPFKPDLLVAAAKKMTGA